MSRLTTRNHNRDSAGMTYVYPVLSRRAGGLSIGINLNTNNACNWRCIYCQVPGLVRGKPQPVDLGLLRDELTQLLEQSLSGVFFEHYGIAPSQRVIRDIALSGNGEPTLSPDFAAVVETIGRVTATLGLTDTVGRVLITNGSGTDRITVRQGLRELARQGGEVWFKVDDVTPTGIRHINQVHLTLETLYRRLAIVTRLCDTQLQTCLFGRTDDSNGVLNRTAYLDFLIELQKRKIPLKGILLYGLARPSHQPEAAVLTRLPAGEIESFATMIRALGYSVRADE